MRSAFEPGVIRADAVPDDPMTRAINSGLRYWSDWFEDQDPALIAKPEEVNRRAEEGIALCLEPVQSNQDIVRCISRGTMLLAREGSDNHPRIQNAFNVALYELSVAPADRSKIREEFLRSGGVYCKPVFNLAELAVTGRFNTGA